MVSRRGHTRWIFGFDSPRMVELATVMDASAATGTSTITEQAPVCYFSRPNLHRIHVGKFLNEAHLPTQLPCNVPEDSFSPLNGKFSNKIGRDMWTRVGVGGRYMYDGMFQEKQPDIIMIIKKEERDVAILSLQEKRGCEAIMSCIIKDMWFTS
ncbi:hypothetical protein AWENTII_006157 [Aspergillus wentii]